MTKTILDNIKYNKFNRLTVGKFSKILLAIDKIHAVSQMSMDCRPGLYGLNQVYRPKHPTNSI